MKEGAVLPALSILGCHDFLYSVMKHFPRLTVYTSMLVLNKSPDLHTVSSNSVSRMSD